MKKTKIICTLGPACDNEETLRSMINNGLDACRINFSHGTYDEQKVRFDRIKKLRNELDIPLPIILDTKGPEIRIRKFENGKIEIKEGQIFTFSSDFNQIGNESIVGLTYPRLAKSVKPKDQILVDDGNAIFEVVEIDKTNVVCKALNPSVLSNNKSINIPGVVIEMPYISDVDRNDIMFGIENDIDFIAASFVRRKEDVYALRGLLEAFDKDKRIKIIAKIENTEGIAKMDEIIAAADGVMVARGDMGVEVPFKLLPGIQKEMIAKCYRRGKIVVTATQMLDSMQHHPRPTRAEVSDVANAIYDQTSAIMLSGETAAGKYPLESVRTMKEIAEATEANIDYHKVYENNKLELGDDFVTTICNAATASSFQVNAKAIICVTINGKTAFNLAAHRPGCPIIAVTVNEKAYRQLKLVWNVFPVKADEKSTTDELFLYAIDKALTTGIVTHGDTVVITGGSLVGEVGTDMLKLHTIK